MNQLNLALPQLELNLDPHRMEDAYSMVINLQIHRGLFRYDPSGKLIPDLVQSFEESKDKLSFRIRLKNATFSDGSKITAENVRQSLARIFFLESSIGADIDYIKGSKEFKRSKNINDLGIKVISDSEVEISLKTPSAIFTKHLATVDCAILKIADFKDKIDFTTGTPLSGPYKIKAISKTTVSLSKWRVDELDSINPPNLVNFSASSKSSFDLAMSGKNDVVSTPIDIKSKNSLIETQHWNSFATEIVVERFLILNPKIVSQAIRAYIFKKIYNSSLLDGIPLSFAKKAHGLIPPNLPGSLMATDIASTVMDFNFARSAIKGTLKLQFASANIVASFLANKLKSLLETKELKIDLEPLAHGAFLEKMFSSQGDILIGAKGLDYFDGFSILSYFRDHYPGNYFHVHDSNIDKKMDKVLTEFDSLQRAKKYKEIQIDILKHLTVVPLLFGSEDPGLWSKKVKSVPAHPGGVHMLPFESIEMN